MSSTEESIITDELAALEACDVPGGRSTNGEIPGLFSVGSLKERGYLEVVKTEKEGGWRIYQWFRTTDAGREYLNSKAAPVGEW